MTADKTAATKVAHWAEPKVAKAELNVGPRAAKTAVWKIDRLVDQ